MAMVWCLPFSQACSTSGLAEVSGGPRASRSRPLFLRSIYRGSKTGTEKEAPVWIIFTPEATRIIVGWRAPKSVLDALCASHRQPQQMLFWPPAARLPTARRLIAWADCSPSSRRRHELPTDWSATTPRPRWGAARGGGWRTQCLRSCRHGGIEYRQDVPRTVLKRSLTTPHES